MTKHWRGWGILDKHISADIFQIDWLQGDYICFLFSFLILGKTENPGTRKIWKAFQTVFIFGSQRAQLWRKVLKCWWCSFSWVCAWAEVTARRSPSFSGPPLRGKVDPFHAVKWLHTVKTKAEWECLDEPASLNCIFLHRAHNRHGNVSNQTVLQITDDIPPLEMQLSWMNHLIT